MELRKITEQDWEQFRKIRLTSLKNDPQAFGASFEEESQNTETDWRLKISKPNRFYFVAEEDEGFVSLACAKKIRENNWMIGAVYTVPEFRRRGLSKELMKIVTEEVKKLGAEKVSLMVNIDQSDAVSLYKNLGFEIIKIEKDLKMGDGKLHDEYYMEKIL